MKYSCYARHCKTSVHFCSVQRYETNVCRERLKCEITINVSSFAPVGNLHFFKRLIELNLSFIKPGKYTIYLPKTPFNKITQFDKYFDLDIFGNLERLLIPGPFLNKYHKYSIMFMAQVSGISPFFHTLVL